MTKIQRWYQLDSFSTGNSHIHEYIAIQQCCGIIVNLLNCYLVKLLMYMFISIETHHVDNNPDRDFCCVHIKQLPPNIICFSYCLILFSCWLLEPKKSGVNIGDLN